jgi:5'-deoxynucleotidase YfbR-like HD superfamily hydrolase
MKQESNILNDIKSFQNILKLKFTYRYSGRLFNGEKESTADHTWFMFIIADYLLAKLEEIAGEKYKLDKLRIYEMIVYHDLIEAET